MKRPKTLLVVANLVLVIIIYFSLIEEKDSTVSLNDEINKLVSTLDKIQILNPSKEKNLTMVRENQEWIIKIPITWPVEKLVYSSFISKLSHLNPEFLFNFTKLTERGEIMSDYGFDDNSTYLSLHGNGINLQVTIGKDTRDNESIYVMIHISDVIDKSIWRVSKDLKDLLSPDPQDWSLPNFINLPLYAIDEASVVFQNDETTSNQTKIVRELDDWFFKFPFNAKANNEKVLFLLNKLVSEKISAFPSNTLALDTKSKSQIQLNINGMGKKYEFYFSPRIDEDSTQILVSSNSGNTPFLIEQSFMDNLYQWSTKLRERTIFNLSVDNIKAMKIKGKEKEIKFSSDSSKLWNILETKSSQGGSFEIDISSIKDFLRSLNQIEVNKFVSFNPDLKEIQKFGFDEPSFEISITNRDNSKQSVLICETGEQSSLWKTYISDQSLICLVEANWPDILITDRLHYRRKNLVSPDSKPSKIILKENANSQEKVVSLEEGDTSFQALSNFNAEEFIHEGFNKEGAWVEGDWVPWKYSISFVDDSGDIKNRFFISERKGATSWFGGSEDFGLTFKLPINIIDELSEVIKKFKPSDQDL